MKIITVHGSGLGTSILLQLTAQTALQRLHVDATGKGLMTRVAGALTDLALSRPDIERVEIHCDETNLASAAVPRRLGYELVSVGPSVRPGGAADSGRHLFWARYAPS